MASLLLLAAIAAPAAPAKPHLVFFLADEYALNQLPATTPHPSLTSRRCGSYGFADVSYHAEMYGHSANVIHTPHLDALSASGVRLENYFVRASHPPHAGCGSGSALAAALTDWRRRARQQVQPVCSPTRATVMTGRYVIHTGIHTAFSDSVPNVPTPPTPPLLTPTQRHRPDE